MLLAGPMLGVALRRQPEMRPGSWMLASMGPILVLTIALGWLAPRFGHPAYLETSFALGVALLGYRAIREQGRSGGSDTLGAVARV